MSADIELRTGARVSVVILTFNAEATISATLSSVVELSDDLHVVDSFSTDRTTDIVEAHFPQVSLTQRPFSSYGDQRNWAIDNLTLRYEWQLHLDADERLSVGLRDEIRSVLASPEVDGYHAPRLVRFMGRPIRHGGMYPIYHLRLFRSGTARCESRRYDQHFVPSGRTCRLRHPMIDDIQLSLRDWTDRHNRWSDAEAQELVEPSGGIAPRPVRGTPQQRKRWLRARYTALPPLGRPWLLFVYRYIFRLGFLDGREGLIFFTLQTLWFRFLVDAKALERERLRALED